MMKAFTAGDRRQCFDRALRAADWFVNSQVRGRELWNADDGRFLYYYNMPRKKYVPGINWTHGRALFVLTDAYKATGDNKYLEAAEYGARYLEALQPLDPANPVEYGAFRERIPQSPWCGVLDGAQAASGLLMLYKMTGKSDYLRRGRAFCEFLLRTWRPDVGLPISVELYPARMVYPANPSYCIDHVSAMPLWHLFKITGEGQFLGPLMDAADRILSCQRPDGALNYLTDISGMKEPSRNHHWGLGEGDERYILRNDDGAVTVMLAAHQVAGGRKYLDAMVRYAEWIVANEPHERPYNAFGIQAANVLDIARVSGRDWSDWVKKHLKARCLDLQVRGSKDKCAEGGFRGEDEQGEGGVFGGKSLDYVPTRNTCYMAGLLFRLSGRGTGSGFSVFGLDSLEQGI